jgi:hypothetical protein
MTQATQWITVVAALVTAGWFGTMVVQLLKRPTWPAWAKHALAIAVSVIVGLAVAWEGHGLTPIMTDWGHLTAAEVLSVGALVYAAAQTWYHLYFKATSWMKALAYWPDKMPQEALPVAKTATKKL